MRLPPHDPLEPWTRAPTRPGRQASARAGTVPKPPLPVGELVVVFAPILLLIALTAGLAIAAWSLGWYRAEMLVAAEVTGVAAGVVAMFLLYRQIRQREAATVALQNVRARVSDIVESAMDPIITIDDDQRVVLFNAAAEKVFRWPRDAVHRAAARHAPPGAVPRRRTARTSSSFGATGATSRADGRARRC